MSSDSYIEIMMDDYLIEVNYHDIDIDVIIVLGLRRATKGVLSLGTDAPGNECPNSVTGLPVPLRVLCRLTRGTGNRAARQPLS